MAFSGGVFSRIHNWVTDAANNINPAASRFDAEDDGFATGLSTALLKDGTQTVTANIPMSTFKFTGLGAGTALTDSANVGQIQSMAVAWIDGGGTDAITGTYSPAVTALVDGQLLGVRATAANTTTTPTFSPNGLTARTIVKYNGAALAVGDIVGDQHDLLLRYDLGNTRWNLLNPATMMLGRHTIPVNASSMITRSTNGAPDVTVELATNDVMLVSKDFDATTSEAVQFYIPMPKSWNEGTLTARFHWTATAGTATQTVIWGIQGLARSDDDPLDTAFGTAVTVSDAYIASGDLHITSETSAMTIGGTPASQDMVIFQVYRDVADTKTGDAKLLAVELFITYDAGSDL